MGADTVKLRTSSGLQRKLVRVMVLTLVGVAGATVLAVAYMNYRSARATLDTIETHIRQSITRKGQGLITNQAMALRSLVADNAFGDVARLVERTVNEDEDMLYGLFLGADEKLWTFVPSAGLVGDRGSPFDFRELGIDPAIVTRPDAEARIRAVAGQEAFEFSSFVAGDDGAVLGRLFYGLSSLPLTTALSEAREESRRTLLLTLAFLSLLGVVATALGITIIRGVAARIIQPLAQLTEVATAIAEGRRDQRFPSWTDDEIGVLGNAFNQMVRELAESYQSLERLNRTLEERVNDRTRELAHRNRDMRLVLDNVNQGFITMSREGILAEERSAIVTRWLGPSAPQQSFLAYVGKCDPVFAEAFELGYEMLLEGFLPLGLCLDQLPKRLRHAGRELEFSYHAIQEQGAAVTLHGDPTTLHSLLIVINDVTAQVRHARQEADRAELLAMVQGFMSDRSGFMSFFDEVTRLVKICHDIDTDPVTRKRALHTIKGNAALAGFGVVGDLCHRAEEQIAEGASAEAGDTVRALSARWDTLGDTFATLLGERARDVVEVQRGELMKLIDELPDTDVSARVTSRLSGWLLEPAERLLRRLARHARSLAQRLGKGEIDVEVDGGGVRIDPQRWQGLGSELVHVVRNAIDHGLESPDERRAASKRPTPLLQLRASTAGDRLIIDIEDDGRGVDWDAVRAIARKRGMRCNSPDELTAVLLAPDVTTKAEATVTSGRGMGLASVADRVRELGGDIAITSRRGHGTRLRLSLPSNLITSPESKATLDTAAPPLQGWS